MSLRTGDLPEPDRFELWRHLAERCYGAVRADTEEPAGFASTHRALNLGNGTVITAEQVRQPVLMSRGAAQIRRSDTERWHLLLITGGGCGFAQDGRAAEFTTGELLLHHTSAPFTSALRGTSSLFLQFPRELAPAGLERLTATPLPARAGLGALVAGTMRELAALPANQVAQAHRLTGVTLDLLGVLALRAGGQRATPSAAPAAALAAARAFIRRELADPALDPAAVAGALHISVRYLHRLFQQEGQTVAGWIRELRLAHCRRDLGDPALREQPAHAIGRRWGFTDSAHFTRAFRGAFGLPPGAYRRLARAGELDRMG